MAYLIRRGYGNSIDIPLADSSLNINFALVNRAVFDLGDYQIDSDNSDYICIVSSTNALNEPIIVVKIKPGLDDSIPAGDYRGTLTVYDNFTLKNGFVWIDEIEVSLSDKTDLEWTSDEYTIDHGNLGGLDDDDHPQYLTISLADSRYLTDASQVFPEQIGHAGEYLTTDGITPYWNAVVGGGGGGVTDHGALTGLSDDDHSQYHTDARGDARYSALGHNHDATYAPLAKGVTNGDSHDHNGGDGAQISYSNLSNIPASFTPAAHATSHKSAGSDTIKLDELAAPTDVTTLNATDSAHGLLPKLANTGTKYLRDDGTWQTVSGGSATQAFGTIAVSGQSDVVADAAPDTLTLVASTNVQITTTAGSDTITIAASHNHDAAYAPIGNGVTNGDSHDHSGGDGGQIAHTALSSIGTNTHAQIDTHLASTSNPHSVTADQVLPSQTGNSGKFLTTNATTASWAAISASADWIYASKTTTYTVLAADKSYWLNCTNTFTLTFSAPATLGANWFCIVKNSGSGIITLSHTSGNIDGLTSYLIYPGDTRFVQCDGSTLRTVLLAGGRYTWTSGVTTFTTPPGIVYLGRAIYAGGGGGASGRKGAAASVRCGGTGGGGGGANIGPYIPLPAAGTILDVEVGAGGTGGASRTANSTNGLNGGTGGTSRFGNDYAYGGGPGAGGSVTGLTGGSGGGIASAGLVGTGTGPVGGSPMGGGGLTNAISAFGGAGGGGTLAQYGGGGGGNTASSGPSAAGGGSIYGGAGGGVGGVITSADAITTALAGGSNSWAVGGGGAAGGTGANGTAGANRTGGGGGGTSITGNAGDGGDGGTPGGGGGGGGAALNDTGNSGGGGDGGSGEVTAWYY